MEIKKPEYEQPRYSAKQPLVRQIFAEEMRKHRGKNKAQCIEYLREHNLMGLVPANLQEK